MITSKKKNRSQRSKPGMIPDCAYPQADKKCWDSGVLRIFILPLFVVFFLFLVSCKPRTQGNDPTGSFSNIYDKRDTSNYTALDVKQTTDGGYIILAMTDSCPYLLRVDKYGDFVWDTDTEALGDYFEPAPVVLVSGTEYFFFCNVIRKETKYRHLALLKFSEPDNSFIEVDLSSFFLDIANIVPMDAKIMSNKDIILLALNSLHYRVLLHRIKPDGKKAWRRDYNFCISCSAKYPFLDRRFHFIESIEKSEENYYNVHSFLYEDIAQYPACFEITTLNPATGELVETNTLNKPFIATVWHSSDRFSAAYINNDIVSFFINSEKKVDWETQQFQIDSNEGLEQIELLEDKPVFIKTAVVNGQTIVFFAGSSKSDQIVLYTYSVSSGICLDKKYFGGTRFYEAAGLIKTADGGIEILGTTYLASLFDRICLFKLSKEELENMVGQ